MPSRPAKIWGAGAFAALTLSVTLPANAQTFTGPQVFEAANRSVDIMRDHVTFLAAQDRYDASLGYFTYTHGFSPARIALNDGRRPRGYAQRASVNVGFGFGSPSKWGLFTGAQVDYVGISTPAVPAISGGAGGQTLAFIGAEAVGFQLTYGQMQKRDIPELDAFGNFNDPGAKGEGKSAGTPPNDTPWLHTVVSAYHTSGASLVVVWAHVYNGSDTVNQLSEVRAQLQPLKRWIDEKAGLPMVALQRLNQYKDYYGEFQQDPLKNTSNVNAPDSTGIVPDRSAPYEFEIGSDDLFKQGIRIHTTNQISPTPKFRKIEGAFYRDVKKITFGARATAYSRNDRLEAALEGFFFLQVTRRPEPGDVGWPFHVAASYSFNTPESMVVLPLPYAHVFGFQLVLGVPETARSIIPVVRAKEDKKNAKPDDGL